MGDKSIQSDDISKMIEENAGKSAPVSQEELMKAMDSMAASHAEEKANDPWIKRSRKLPAYALDVIRDGSDEYHKALTDAILAITEGEYGYIDYKGYKIYYNDTPHLKSISLKDGKKEYSYWISFECDALRCTCYEEYESEEERKGFLDPKNELFEKTLAMLDREIEYLDEGSWIKEKKKLNIYDFKDYTPGERRFESIEWDERNKIASNMLSYLMDDALKRARGHEYTEADFAVFADVIRTMIYFADYGKRNYLFELEGLIQFKWKPKTKHDRFIWQCMDEFGQGDLPNRLFDNCTLYYFLHDPQGWEAVAYLAPIMALWEMCHDYDPDSIKDGLLRLFDRIPAEGDRERIEKLIEEDRAKAGKGGDTDDWDDI
ncbi:MAG: hypothetical protein J5509_06955 [Lachnospiraceae bacterium]|nr:hypothetical protein [Lachnospiraceae bacterium]